MRWLFLILLFLLVIDYYAKRVDLAQKCDFEGSLSFNFFYVQRVFIAFYPIIDSFLNVTWKTLKNFYQHVSPPGFYFAIS